MPLTLTTSMDGNVVVAIVALLFENLMALLNVAIVAVKCHWDTLKQALNYMTSQCHVEDIAV
jgi:hypothetical protein